MLIVCPNCLTSYEINAGKLGPRGRSVRCARCKTAWTVSEPAMEPPAEQALVQAAAAARGSSAAEAGAVPFSPPPESMPAAKAPATDTSEAWPDPADETFGNPPSVPALIEHGPPLAPAIDPAASVPFPANEPAFEAESEPAPPEDIEAVAARRARIASVSRRKRRRRPGLGAVILLMFAVLAALVYWRGQIVRLAPQTAAIYSAVGLPVNLRGLIFTDLKTTGEMQDETPVLVVQGRIVNTTGRTIEVPRLRFALRNAEGVEVYAWTAPPTQPTLSPGEALPFRSRLASPPADTKDVQVRFHHRRDLSGP